MNHRILSWPLWNAAGRRRAGAMMMVCALSACAPESDQVVLQQAIDAMEEAVEAGDPGAFMAHVSDTFSGQSGEMDAGQLRATLLALRLRHEHVGITPSAAEFKLAGDHATINLEVLAVGGSWMPESGQVLQIQSHWQRVDGEWKCFAASWVGRW